MAIAATLIVALGVWYIVYREFKVINDELTTWKHMSLEEMRHYYTLEERDQRKYMREMQNKYGNC